MISPEKLDALQGQWVRLLGGFGVAVAAAYPPFDRLVAAYARPGRHYHTLEHVAEMLKLVGKLATRADHPADVLLAVWFHDAVYDPRATDNEERSAALAEAELTALGIPAARAVELIRMTDHKREPNTPDAEVLIDADLAILGASEVRYDRYAADVRKEYTFVPDAEYRAGRAAVLEHFLNRSRLFRTPILAEMGEAAARANLQRELAALRG